MPYGRYRRRRRFYRRRKPVPWYAKKYSLGSLASKAWSGVKYLKGLVNAERYKLDTSATTTDILNTGTVVHLSAVAQGDGDSARTGNSIFARSLLVRGFWTWNSTAAAPQQVRVSVVQDLRQISDTAPGFTDIYAGANVQSFLNTATVGSFKVLRTLSFSINDMVPERRFQIKIPMRHHIRYNGTASSDIQKGGLYLVMSSDQTTSNGPTMTWISRLSYHDN